VLVAAADVCDQQFEDDAVFAFLAPRIYQLRVFKTLNFNLPRTHVCHCTISRHDVFLPFAKIEDLDLAPVLRSSETYIHRGGRMNIARQSADDLQNILELAFSSG
jgi:hypothetical protein